MNSIKATWTNGQIFPAEPVDWPEGSQLLVTPLVRAEFGAGLAEENWRDDQESISAWVAAVEQIEPFLWRQGECEEYERYRDEVRQFNIEATRRQMRRAGGADAE